MICWIKNRHLLVPSPHQLVSRSPWLQNLMPWSCFLLVVTLWLQRTWTRTESFCLIKKRHWGTSKLQRWHTDSQLALYVCSVTSFISMSLATAGSCSQHIFLSWSTHNFTRFSFGNTSPNKSYKHSRVREFVCFPLQTSGAGIRGRRRFHSNPRRGSWTLSRPQARRRTSFVQKSWATHGGQNSNGGTTRGIQLCEKCQSRDDSCRRGTWREIWLHVQLV